MMMGEPAADCATERTLATEGAGELSREGWGMRLGLGRVNPGALALPAEPAPTRALPAVAVTAVAARAAGLGFCWLTPGGGLFVSIRLALADGGTEGPGMPLVLLLRG
jgi:hypothetical protein